jgi:hypothetical protein
VQYLTKRVQVIEPSSLHLYTHSHQQQNIVNSLQERSMRLDSYAVKMESGAQHDRSKVKMV